MAQACANNENEILQARTQLDLAKTKTDIDGIFVAASNLIQLGDTDPALPAALEKVKKSLSLYELIRVSQSEGTHEKTIQLADEFLEYFPNHIDVRKAMRESGQIFKYLNESLNEFQSCFRQSADGGFLYVSIKNAEYFQIDYNVVSQRLWNARQSVEDALRRDPNFDTALNLRRLIVNAQIALSSALTQEIFTIINRHRPAVENTFKAVHAEMQKSIHSRFGSPQKVWKRFQSNMTTLEAIHQEEIVDLNRLASLLPRLENEANESLIVSARNAVMIYDQYVNTVIYPRSSLMEYGNDYRSIASKWSEIDVWYQGIESNLNNLKDNITQIASLAMEFCLYKNEQTPHIIQKRLEIIEL
jgi:tetratricopeptide (TPR) repeat protein